jgi:hypothetical protein
MIAQVILTKKLHNKIYVLLNYNFIMKEMIKLVHSITPTCLHPYRNDRTRWRNVHLGAGAWERIPWSSSKRDWSHRRPEPKFRRSLTNPAQEGKPRCMIPVFQLIQLLFLFTCAFKFIGVDWNPSYMILGTYVMNTRTGVRVDALLIGSEKVKWFPVTRENYRSWMIYHILQL